MVHDATTFKCQGVRHTISAYIKLQNVQTYNKCVRGGVLSKGGGEVGGKEGGYAESMGTPKGEILWCFPNKKKYYVSSRKHVFQAFCWE